MKTSRVIVAALFALSAGVFAIGVSVERSQSTHHDEPVARAGVTPAATAAEGSAEREAAEKKAPSTGQPAVAATETGSESSEKLFGVNTESAGLVVVVVAISLALAAAAVVVRSPMILAAIIIVALGAAAFDVREVLHQIDESRNGVAALAVLTAALHILVAVVASWSGIIDRGESTVAAAG